MQRPLADDSVQEIDGGQSMRGKEAIEALFSRLHLNKTNMSAPVCEFHVSQRIYDRSSDREILLL